MDLPKKCPNHSAGRSWNSFLLLSWPIWMIAVLPPVVMWLESPFWKAGIEYEHDLDGLQSEQGYIPNLCIFRPSNRRGPFQWFYQWGFSMFGAENDVGVNFWQGLWHGCGIFGLRSFGAFIRVNFVHIGLRPMLMLLSLRDVLLINSNGLWFV